MKIALFGASGTIGQRIMREALERGHEVTAVVRDRSRFKGTGEKLSVAEGDAVDASSIAGTVEGHDAVISAVGPKLTEVDSQFFVKAARALLEGMTRAGVKRLLVVGGAGSLEVAQGVQLVDTPEFPEAWKQVALAHRDALEVYRTAESNLDWTYFSPAALIEPGVRTGQYRIGGERLLVDEKGESRISTEDYAAAMLDEIENPAHVRQRMTAAY